MEFYERFELQDLIRDGADDGIKTFDGREVATGRALHVHLFLTPKAPIQAALLKALNRLPDGEAQRIIHRGKNEGTHYLVTERLLEHESLEQWVLKASRQQLSGNRLNNNASAGFRRTQIQDGKQN